MSIDQQTIPAVFVGHGAPTNALESNRWTDGWRAFGARHHPKAILAISAHWTTEGTFVTAGANPRTIHDFYGFPDELATFEYPAPGSADLVADVIELTKPLAGVNPTDRWGLDHGTWSVLAHMYPHADIPVVQLSIDQTKSADFHLQLGRALAPLTSAGVLVLGSGNVVHNLGSVDWSNPNAGYSWATEYDDTARSILTTRPVDIDRLFDHEHHQLANPTPEHLLPLLPIAGIADVSERPMSTLLEGITMGSVSMAAYEVSTARRS